MKPRHSILLAAVAASVPAFPLHAEEVAFTSVRAGRTSAIPGKTQTVVARTVSQWRAAFQLPAVTQGESPPTPIEPPEIDFDKQMIVGVLVPGSSSCTAGKIKRVEREPGRLVVTYETWPYRANQICAESFMLAYHFVAIPISELQVDFVERKP